MVKGEAESKISKKMTSITYYEQPIIFIYFFVLGLSINHVDREGRGCYEYRVDHNSGCKKKKGFVFLIL